MPAPAVLTLIGTAALVAVLAGYLIRVALILRHVVLTLETILAAVAAVSDQAAPIGDVVGAINADLEAGQSALQDAAAKAAEGTADEPAAAGSAPGARGPATIDPPAGAIGRLQRGLGPRGF